MSIGNGKVLCYVFAVDPSDGPIPITPSFDLPTGVSFMVNMPEAMASDSTLFSLRMRSIDTVPSMFHDRHYRDDRKHKFRQTHKFRDDCCHCSCLNQSVG